LREILKVFGQRQIVRHLLVGSCGPQDPLPARQIAHPGQHVTIDVSVELSPDYRWNFVS
jgi:hypothetical protein